MFRPNLSLSVISFALAMHCTHSIATDIGSKTPSERSNIASIETIAGTVTQLSLEPIPVSIEATTEQLRSEGRNHVSSAQAGMPELAEAQGPERGTNQREILDVQQMANVPQTEIAAGSLSEIAERLIVGSDISLEQMALAVYNKNQAAFIDNDINKIIAGQLLTLPSLQEAGQVLPEDAKQQFRDQTQQWRKDALGVPAEMQVKPPFNRYTSKILNADYRSELVDPNQKASPLMSADLVQRLEELESAVELKNLQLASLRGNAIPADDIDTLLGNDSARVNNDAKIVSSVSLSNIQWWAGLVSLLLLILLGSVAVFRKQGWSVRFGVQRNIVVAKAQLLYKTVIGNDALRDAAQPLGKQDIQGEPHVEMSAQNVSSADDIDIKNDLPVDDGSIDSQTDEAVNVEIKTEIEKPPLVAAEMYNAFGQFDRAAEVLIRAIEDDPQSKQLKSAFDNLCVTSGNDAQYYINKLSTQNASDTRCAATTCAAITNRHDVVADRTILAEQDVQALELALDSLANRSLAANESTPLSAGSIPADSIWTPPVDAQLPGVDGFSVSQTSPLALVKAYLDRDDAETARILLERFIEEDSLDPVSSTLDDAQTNGSANEPDHCAVNGSVSDFFLAEKELAL